jgi:hypothetical protein
MIGALVERRFCQFSDIHTEGNVIMKILQHSMVAAVLTLGGAAAMAQTAASAPAGIDTPRIDQRQANQAKRIDQGIASGTLTPREARRLERQQAVIGQAEAKAKSDGTVTAQERRRLTRAQNHTSRHVARQKHDRQGAARP